jgi:hypothetical protein
MTNYPAAPDWKAVCCPTKLPKEEHKAENGRRIATLVDWLDRCQQAEHKQGNAVDISHEDLDRVARENCASRLTVDEQAALLEIFNRKASQKPKPGKARNENGWKPLAELLRTAPSQRLVLVVADLIEFGAFTNAADLRPSMKMRAIDASEWRAWILERLLEAYDGEPYQLLLERASDLTVAFTDLREVDSIHHFNLEVADRGRMRLASLINSIRKNRWPSPSEAPG